MYALIALTLLITIAYTQAGAIGLAGSLDGAAIIAGPSGTVKRTGYAALGPIAAPGVIIAGPALAPAGLISASAAPGAIISGPALGLRLAAPGLALGGLELAAPGLAALSLEGSGIEGQYIPDYSEKLYDDGSYKPDAYKN